MLTGEVATTIQDMMTTTIKDMTTTTIQDINLIIVLTFVVCFSLLMTELIIFIMISINSY